MMKEIMAIKHKLETQDDAIQRHLDTQKDVIHKLTGNINNLERDETDDNRDETNKR